MPGPATASVAYRWAHAITGPAAVIDDEALISAYTRPTCAALVPEFRLHLAEKLVPLWQAIERRAAGRPVPPPFWAFAWPGSQALARYLLDTPHLVRARRVLDFGSGGGLAAIAAAHLGAAHVLACDVDCLAAIVQQLNADLNGVTLRSELKEVVGRSAAELNVDVLLAGDVCYERTASEQSVPWLRDLARQGVLVLLADPGRHYAPADGLTLLATYDVPTLIEIESAPFKRTRLWRVLS